MKANKKFLAVKIESGGYGVDATPAIGTDDVLVSNFSITPLNIRYAERNTARPYFSAREKINVGDTVQMEFDIEVSGAGTVVGIPAYGKLLRICAMSETVTPTTGPVTYGMISDGEESATFYFNWDGVRHIALGVRGNCEWRYTAGGIAYIHVTVEALVGDIGVAALGGTPDYTAFKKPVAVTKANTTFALHGYSAALESLTITRGAQNVYKNRPNSEQLHFVDGQVTGQVAIVLPKTDVKDFFAICRAGTTGELAMTHGTVTGNKAILAASKVQLTNPRTSESDNMIMLTMDTIYLPATDAGSNELTYATQ